MKIYVYQYDKDGYFIATTSEFPGNKYYGKDRTDALMNLAASIGDRLTGAIEILDEPDPALPPLSEPDKK